MTKEEIKKKIFALQTEEEIIEFVNERLNELEASSEEKTVGQNYTDSFQDYISKKVHYKATEKFENQDSPDLVYDDITPYINLIKEIRKNSWYSELTLFTTIFYTIYDYLPNKDFGFDRYFVYESHLGKQLSIKTVSEEKVGMCSEKAGMAHNMFKFLGIDSELICGARESEVHAYNFIYPNGYGNEPMILYDPSYFVSFIKENDKKSYGFYKALRKEDYETLKRGIPMQLDLTKTEEKYRKLYGFNGALDDYTFENNPPVYVYGLDNTRNYLNSKKIL